MSDSLKTLVVGVGNMGLSHALAYQKLDGFELAGFMSRTIKSRTDLPPEVADIPRFEDYEEALATVKPDVVSINTYTDSHTKYALRALDNGCHIFMEKPIATTAADAERIVAKAKEKGRKLVIGYILRVHPSWSKFVEVAQTLGKPLVMRMNLNQQSGPTTWAWHKSIMGSLSPLVDCGVHYVDVMCQMTKANPVRVHGIGAHLTDEVEVYNYGHLHVTFDDGSVGWYEAGWGPMMSEVAYFIKDVVGPKGCASIVVPQDGTADTKLDSVSDSADINQHTKTNAIKIHHSQLDANDNFVKPDEWINTEDEPDHQELCDREQAYLLKAIQENIDLTDSMEDAVKSLKIVLAADESIRLGKSIDM